MNNNDIYSFINSKDVRNYLKEIDYQFSSPEAAWLVFQCRTLTIRERYEAWQDIIDTMPDAELESPHFRHFGERYFLHDILKKGIENEKRRFSEFCAESPGAVFTFQIRQGRYKWNSSDLTPFYSGYSACLEAVRQEIGEINSDADPEYRVTSVRITKKITEKPGAETLLLDAARNLEPLSLDSISPRDNSVKHNPPDSDAVDLTDVLQSLWFCFPVPFKKGDIVREVSSYPDTEESAAPLVIISTDSQGNLKAGYKGCDCSDMRIDGYFLDNRGMLYWDYTFTYMDYEFFPEECLTGKNRMLKALRSYLRDEIPVDLFVNACISIFMTEMSQEENFPGAYTREWLFLAGLVPSGERESASGEK